LNKILFCGSYIPEELIEHYKYSSQAGNNFQKEVIKNLARKNEIQILTYIGYPIEPETIQKMSSALEKKGILYIIRSASSFRIYSFLKYILLLCKAINNNQVILLYNYYYINFMVPYLSRITGVKSVLIVADHTEPEEYSNPVRKFLAKKISHDFEKFDLLVFLSEKLYNRYKYKNSIVMEGGIDFELYRDFQPQRVGNKIRILYSGTLNTVTGINILLDSIKGIKESNVEFIITGRGEYESQIVDMQKQDVRINYLGFISQKDYMDLLGNVHILVNPRNMELPQNDNNFPSKILEYLASGRIVISTRFPGYEKFIENIYFCDSMSSDLANQMKNVIDNYNIIYNKSFTDNRELAKNFDWKIQIKKIEEELLKI